MKQYIIIFLLIVASIFIPNNAYGQFGRIRVVEPEEESALNYAKTHSPIKSITFQAISVAIIGLYDNTPQQTNGSVIIYFYDGEAKNVIKFDNHYYYKVAVDGNVSIYALGTEENHKNAFLDTLELYMDQEGGLLRGSRIWDYPYEHVTTIALYGYGYAAGNSQAQNIITNQNLNIQQNNYNSSICNSCSGTGKCTACGGRGQYWVDSGMYTGSGSRTLVNCGSCGGSGNCGVCYGIGKIR